MFGSLLSSVRRFSSPELTPSHSGRKADAVVVRTPHSAPDIGGYSSTLSGSPSMKKAGTISGAGMLRPPALGRTLSDLWAVGDAEGVLHALEGLGETRRLLQPYVSCAGIPQFPLGFVALLAAIASEDLSLLSLVVRQDPSVAFQRSPVENHQTALTYALKVCDTGAFFQVLLKALDVDTSPLREKKTEALKHLDETLLHCFHLYTSVDEGKQEVLKAAAGLLCSLAMAWLIADNPLYVASLHHHPECFTTLVGDLRACFVKTYKTHPRSHPLMIEIEKCFSQYAAQATWFLMLPDMPLFEDARSGVKTYMVDLLRKEVTRDGDAEAYACTYIPKSVQYLALEAEKIHQKHHPESALFEPFTSMSTARASSVDEAHACVRRFHVVLKEAMYGCDAMGKALLGKLFFKHPEYQVS
jgi:hypothetical protein